MATKDGLAQIWYADANGVITGNTPSADNVASAIIDGYNEHFGTGIQIWTPETKSLQVGDTVPNWNAYEKIMLQSQKVAIYVGDTSSPLVFGITQNLKVILSGTNENEAMMALNTGQIVGSTINITIPENSQNLLNKLHNQFPQISEIECETSTFNVGDTIEDWEDYLKIE